MPSGYELVQPSTVSSRPSGRSSRRTKTRCGTRSPECLGVSVGQIGVKAKTGEGVGPVGREEAIDARCVALVVAKHE